MTHSGSGCEGRGPQSRQAAHCSARGKKQALVGSRAGSGQPLTAEVGRVAAAHVDGKHVAFLDALLVQAEHERELRAEGDTRGAASDGKGVTRHQGGGARDGERGVLVRTSTLLCRRTMSAVLRPAMRWILVATSSAVSARDA